MPFKKHLIFIARNACINLWCQAGEWVASFRTLFTFLLQQQNVECRSRCELNYAGINQITSNYFISHMLLLPSFLCRDVEGRERSQTSPISDPVFSLRQVIRKLRLQLYYAEIGFFLWLVPWKVSKQVASPQLTRFGARVHITCWNRIFAKGCK